MSKPSANTVAMAACFWLPVLGGLSAMIIAVAGWRAVFYVWGTALAVLALLGGFFRLYEWLETWLRERWGLE